MPKHAGGRPTKLTPALITSIATDLRAGATVRQACARARVSEQTYHAWLRRADNGGIHAELRDAVHEAVAAAGVKALAQVTIAGATDWQAATWMAERADRLLRNLEERPNVLRDHEWRRGEWKAYDFDGSARERGRKVDFLAHLEEKLTPNAACRAARVHRWEYKEWVETDPTFANCVAEAVLVAAYQAEEMLLRGALTLDKEGKVQTTAVFGILNAKSTEYGLIKAQTYAQNNAKLVREVGEIILADIPVDAAAKLREGLDDLVARAAKLPPGASLR